MKKTMENPGNVWKMLETLGESCKNAGGHSWKIEGKHAKKHWEKEWNNSETWRKGEHWSTDEWGAWGQCGKWRASTDVWEHDDQRMGVWAFKIFKRWEKQSVKSWRYGLLLKQIACRRYTHQMLGLPTLKPSNFRIKFRTWCRQNKIWYSAPEMEDVHQMMSIGARWCFLVTLFINPSRDMFATPVSLCHAYV